MLKAGAKIAVTGAAGYVGNVVCRDLLEKGYKVKAIDNFHKGHADALLSLVNNQQFEFYKGDVTCLDQMESLLSDVDGIIHLAAIVGFPACDAQPALASAVNCEGTKNVLLAAVKHVPSCPLVYASTGSVYGAVDGICTEESPKNTKTLYGITKLMAEEYVMSYPNTVSLRFATGFGCSPCMRVNLLVNDLVYQAVTNGVLNVFEGNANRTFIHVRDMSRAIILSLEKLMNYDLSHKVYNVGDNNMNITKIGLANLISEITGCKVFTSEFGKDKDCRDYIVDYSKINSEGFNCTISITEGIKELIKTSSILQMRNPYA